jgi:predicted nucleic acid-binding protein
MTKAVLLDAGPLSMAAHPKSNADFASWLEQLLQAGVTVLVPEIADYGVRRELLRAGKTQSVARLDQLKATLAYLPLTTPIMLQAADFWATSRRSGVPTADPKELDADVILAAQCESLTRIGHQAVVATDNVGHLQRFVAASPWKDIS